MREGLCGSCKFWGADEICYEPEYGIEADGVEMQACRHPMAIQPNYGEKHNTGMRTDGVWTADEDGYPGELLTGEAFGCIHWEKDV